MSLLTTVIGSYPFSYDELGKEAVVRSVQDQLDAGVDLVTDGQTRYDMIGYFAQAIDGYAYDRASSRGVIRGKIGKGDPDIFLQDLEVTRSMAERVKGNITGPVTLVFSSSIEGHYRGFHDREVYFDTARALLDIALDLQRNGVEWIQIDEPFLSVGAPMDIAREAVEIVARGLNVPVALHVCGNVNLIFRDMLEWEGIRMLSHAFMGDGSLEILDYPELKLSDKVLGLGCIDTKSTRVEEIEEISGLIGKALERVPPERIAIHPDCGLRTLPREVAFEKLQRMVIAADRAVA
ncbi:MAG: hypothetical protein R6T78_03785 [Dehalococcoidales bacterium]